VLDIFTIQIPGSPFTRNTGPLIDDERGFRKSVVKDFVKGTEGKAGLLRAGVLAASRHSVSCLLIFSRRTQSAFRLLFCRE